MTIYQKPSQVIQIHTNQQNLGTNQTSHPSCRLGFGAMFWEELQQLVERAAGKSARTGIKNNPLKKSMNVLVWVVWNELVLREKCIRASRHQVNGPRNTLTFYHQSLTITTDVSQLSPFRTKKTITNRCNNKRWTIFLWMEIAQTVETSENSPFSQQPLTYILD